MVVPFLPEAAADVLPAFQRSFDEPSAANSAIPLWFLSRAAKEHVEVVLCGEGGDELFLGYNRHLWSERMRRAAPLMGLARKVRGRFPRSGHRKLNYLRDYAGRFCDGAELANGYERFIHAVRISSPGLRGTLYDRGFAENIIPGREAQALAATLFPDRDEGLADIEEFAMGDISVHLQASLLQRLDRASMAHSLEARVPFLTRGFIDWALTVPTEFKLCQGTGKWVLREAVKPWLPSGAIAQDKKGFQLPLADWFIGDFNDFARDAWFASGAGSAGFLRPEAAESLFDEHRSGTANHGRMLYALAMFGCWWNDQKEFVARRPETAGQRAFA
jgi:asparagine synthase (glutamine-hydrolysing)